MSMRSALSSIASAKGTELHWQSLAVFCSSVRGSFIKELLACRLVLCQEPLFQTGPTARPASPGVPAIPGASKAMIRFTLKVLFVPLLTCASLAAQARTAVSGTASTIGPCSPSVVAGDFKNQQNCTFIVNRYQVRRIYQRSKSVTVALSHEDLDYIVKQVAQQILEVLQKPEPERGFQNILNVSYPFTGSGISGNGQEVPSALGLASAADTYMISDPLVGIPMLPPNVSSTAFSTVSSELSTSTLMQSLSIPDKTVDTSALIPGSRQYSLPLTGIPILETDQLVRIDTTAITSSVLTLLSTPTPSSSFPPNDIAALLHLGSDGSLAITGTTDNVLGSSITLTGTTDVNPIGSGNSANLGLISASSNPKSLTIDGDGYLKIDGISLKSTSMSSFPAKGLSSLATAPTGTTFTDMPLWQGPEMTNRPKLTDSGAEFRQVDLPVCDKGAVISFAGDGVVTPCRPATDTQ
jgi:hypothetical protein